MKTSAIRSSLLLFGLLAAPWLFASPTDSLLKALEVQTDTLKVKVLNELCYAVVYDDVELSKKYGFEALNLARELQHTRGMAIACTRIGIAYDVESDFDSAIWYYNRALIYFTQCNNPHGKASALNNKAMVYSNRGQYKEALAMYMGALKVFEDLGDKLHIGNALNNIAVLYNDMLQHRISLTYSRKALRLYQEVGNEGRIAAAYTNMGLSYSDINTDSFIYYTRHAIALKEKGNDRFGLGISFNDMGLCYAQLKRYDSSIFYFKKSLGYKAALNDEFGEASVLINMAISYASTHNRTEQLACLERAGEIAKDLKSYRLLYKVASGLSTYYLSGGNYKEAYSYQKLFTAYKDTILNSESTEQIRELEAKYQSEKKELELRNTNLALQASESGLKQKRTQVWLLLAVLAAAVVLALLIYFSYLNRQKRKEARQRIEEEQARNRAVITAENEERKRIAKDLHDGVGQQLSAVKMNLSAWASDNHTSALDEVMRMLDEAVKEVRSVSHSMIPNALLNAGLSSALRDFMNKLSLSGKIEVDVQLVGITGRLNENTETTLYRIIQECISNVIKHSGAHKLTLQLINHPGHILLMIEDDGKGFDINSTPGGIGIRNIESRVAYLNGRMDIDSTPGNGTTITIEIPHETT